MVASGQQGGLPWQSVWETLINRCLLVILSAWQDKSDGAWTVLIRVW